MKIIILIFLVLTFSSCGKIPAPSILTPSESINLKKANYGEAPKNYQKILKDYLIKNLNNHKTAKVEFVNEPTKISIDHLGDTYAGYRVCLSISEKRGEYYLNYKNHFFLINNNEVELHLFDSGLLTIPFKYCVARDKTRELFVADIPDEKEINVESMDKIKLTSKDNTKYKKLETELEKLKKENKELKNLGKNKIEYVEDLAKIDSNDKSLKVVDNIYILCIFDDKEMTYIFNDSKETFKLMNKLDIVSYDVSFNDAYIVATNENIELTINRVSGGAVINDVSKGQCKLTDKRKF